MKKTLSLLTIAASLLIVSCKKETTPSPVNQTVTKKLAQSTLNPNSSFTYNADGTLHELITNKPSGDVSKKTMTYSPGKITYLWTYNGKKDEVGEYTMVNGKAMAFTWTHYAANGDPIKTYNESFAYNAKGLLEKHVFNDGAFWLYQYDGNDNIASATYHNAQQQAISKTVYTYGNQLDRFPMFGYFNSWGAGFFVPLYSKYLPVALESTDLLTQTVTYKGTFSYELDAAGYVTKGAWHKIISPGNDYSWVNVYQ